MACNLCRADDTELIFEGHDRLHDVPGTYRLVRCRQCGLLYLDPRPTPEQLEKHYPQDYMSYMIAVDDEPRRLKRWDRYYGLYKRYRAVTRVAGDQPRRILDVGCATGNFLDVMRRHGWETAGVEINPHAAQRARERLGLDVLTGTLEQAGFPDDAFDAVTMWDVLEHVDDPLGTLREISRVLRPGGTLVFSLPNPETWEIKLFGPFWIGWDTPRHLHLFTRDVVLRYLAETDFELIKITSFIGRYHVFVMSVDVWARERCPRWHKLLVGLLRLWPMRLLGLAFFALTDRVKLSSSMTVFARQVERREVNGDA